MNKSYSIQNLPTPQDLADYLTTAQEEVKYVYPTISIGYWMISFVSYPIYPGKAWEARTPSRWMSADTLTSLIDAVKADLTEAAGELR